MFGIACGYADANDGARLAHDPVFKLLIGRDAVDGHDLASQPTLSRFENTIRPRDLLCMSEALAEAVINRHKRRKKKVKLITIDLDPTDDPAHGHQQFSLFNGFYDSNCYLPLAGFLTFDKEPEQYLFSYLLRPGNADAKQGCFGLLKRVLPKLRQAVPGAVIRLRLDSGFSGPDLYEFMEAQKCEYVVAMAKNSVLIPGEPTACTDDGGGLCVVSGIAFEGSTHAFSSSTGLNDSATPVEVRRLGRIFRSSCRFAFTHQHTLFQ